MTKPTHNPRHVKLGVLAELAMQAIDNYCKLGNADKLQYHRIREDVHDCNSPTPGQEAASKLIDMLGLINLTPEILVALEELDKTGKLPGEGGEAL